MEDRQHAPSTARNREPILEVLRRVLAEAAEVLEIASGTGEHAAHFAAALPGTRWQPSDRDRAQLTSIDAWGAPLRNVRRALELDVTSRTWPVSASAFDAVFNANMIHIAPWEVALGLLEGAARHLRPDGVLILYGPYRIAGEHTAPSNAAFDRQLRARDPSWGIRDLEAVVAAGVAVDLAFAERIEMPANNQILVLRAGASVEA